MKNTIILAALTMMCAAPAMASKARLEALDNSAHLSDIQDVFSNAAKLTNSGDWLTFEMGQTPAGTPGNPADPKAEGGFSRSMGDAKYGFYLGHHDALADADRVGAGYLTDENPINLFYAAKTGDMAWGVGLSYSSSDKKTTTQKQSATGINGGVVMGQWAIGADIGVANTYKNDTAVVGPPAVAAADFKGTTAFALNAQYYMNAEWTFDAMFNTNGGKDTTAGTDITSTGYGIGFVKDHKADGADFFWGANVTSVDAKEKNSGNKYDAMMLPVFVGIEADATSWMVLRASVTQNVLLGSQKGTANLASASTDADTIPNDTVVAAGVGFKWNKLMLDATLKSATSGNIDGGSLFANAGLTYMF